MLNTSEIIKLQQGFGQEWQKPRESWIFPRRAFYLFWTQVVIHSLGKLCAFFFNKHWKQAFFSPKKCITKILNAKVMFVVHVCVLLVTYTAVQYKSLRI